MATLPEAPTRREFLRLVYREAEAAGVTREEYLDGLAKITFAEVESGKTLVASSGGGFSASYALFGNWNPQTRLALIDWARRHIEAETIDEALAEVPGAVKFYRKAVTHLRYAA